MSSAGRSQLTRTGNVSRQGARFIAGPGGIRQPSQNYRHEPLMTASSYVGQHSSGLTRSTYHNSGVEGRLHGQTQPYLRHQHHPRPYTSPYGGTSANRPQPAMYPYSQHHLHSFSSPQPRIASPQGLGIRSVSPNLRSPPQKVVKVTGPVLGVRPPSSAPSQMVPPTHAREQLHITRAESTASSEALKHEEITPPSSPALVSSAEGSKKTESPTGPDPAYTTVKDGGPVPDGQSSGCRSPEYYDYTEDFEASEQPAQPLTHPSRLPLRIRTPNRQGVAVIGDVPVQLTRDKLSAWSASDNHQRPSTIGANGHTDAGRAATDNQKRGHSPPDQSEQSQVDAKPSASVNVSGHTIDSATVFEPRPASPVNMTSAFSYSSSESSAGVYEDNTLRSGALQCPPNGHSGEVTSGEDRPTRFRLRGRQSRIEMATPSLDYNPWRSTDHHDRQAEWSGAPDGPHSPRSFSRQRHSYPPKLKLKLCRTSTSSLNSFRVKNPSPVRSFQAPPVISTTECVEPRMSGGLNQPSIPNATATSQTHEAGVSRHRWGELRTVANHTRDDDSVASSIDPALRDLYPTDWRSIHSDVSSETRRRTATGLPTLTAALEQPATDYACTLQVPGDLRRTPLRSSDEVPGQHPTFKSGLKVGESKLHYRARRAIKRLKQWVVQGKEHAMRAKKCVIWRRTPPGAAKLAKINAAF